MSSLLQLNYDELVKIARIFRDEGETLLQDHSLLRQRMHALRQDWIGKSADAFYKEMEEVALPAHKRAGEALLLADEALRKIMQIIQLEDDEIAQHFSSESVLGGTSNNPLPGQNSPSNAESGGSSGSGAGGSGSGGSGSGDPGSGGSGPGDPAPGANQPSAAEQSAAQENSSSGGQKLGGQQPTPTDPASSSGGGGGGGSSSSGLQGSLNGLGSALGAEPTQTSATSGGEQPMPDHLFTSNNPPVVTESPDPALQPDFTEKPGVSAGSMAAGLAGAAAAIGAAAKKVKDLAKESRE